MPNEDLDPGLEPTLPQLPEVDIPDLPTAKDPPAVVRIKDRFSSNAAFDVAFIGLGQGGSRIAESFFKMGYGRVCVLNTTHQDLDEIDPAIPRLDLQTGGAGKDTAYAEAAIKNRTSEVWELLQRSWGTEIDYAMVCVGLGGGTGTGTAPKAVEIAVKYMNELHKPPRVGVIAALPTLSEGGQQLVARNVTTGFRNLTAMAVSPLILIDNARINSLYKPRMPDFYDTCNKQTSVLFHLFNRLAGQRSKYITFDRSELGRIFDGGLITMGASQIKQFDSPAAISKAIREQLETTVLAQVDLSQAKQAACIFVGGPGVLNSLSIDFFEEGFNTVQRMIADSGIVHRGVYEGTTEDLRCYTILGSLPPPYSRLEELARRGSVLSGTSTLAAYLGVDDGPR